MFYLKPSISLHTSYRQIKHNLNNNKQVLFSRKTTKNNIPHNWKKGHKKKINNKNIFKTPFIHA